MTADEERTIRLLETSTRQLILKYQQVKEENDELRGDLANKDKELQAVKEQNKTLQTNYNNLKMAKMLEVGDNDIAAARQRMSRLVRDVDKCIALLKAMGPEQTMQ